MKKGEKMRLKYLFVISILFIITAAFSSAAAHKVVKKAYLFDDIFNFQKNQKIYIGANNNVGTRNNIDPIIKAKEESLYFVQLSNEMEEEYKTLLEEKKKLENDKSFQKRKIKRKYQNRPYIKELIEKEQRLNERLEEIEKLRKAASEEQ